MAVSELHHRLEYLVAYSSQMIFVSGDSISHQKSVIQSFLAQQHETTEIAFVNGEENRSDSDYRKEIIRQLIGRRREGVEQNITSLQGAVDLHSEQIMICICGAQYISKDLLTELWQLVIHSKESAKKQHLNVILFGQSDWTEQAKNWLPTHSADRPVLLSSELVNEPQEESLDLNTLIAEKRAQFAQRLQARALSQKEADSDQSVIQTFWFKSLVIIGFFTVFGSIIFFQYKTEISAFLDIDSSIYPTVDVSQSDNAQIENDADPEIEEQTVQASVKQESEQFLSGQTSQPQSDDSEQSALSADQQPVASWQDKVAQMRSAASEETESDSPSDTESTAGLVPSLPTQPEDRQVTEANAVADIAEDLLENLAPTQFVIQLSAASNANTVEAYIEQQAIADRVWQYKTKRFGGDWYVIVYKRGFDSVRQAREYLTKLPDGVQATQPFVKSVKQVQEEMSVVSE